MFTNKVACVYLHHIYIANFPVTFVYVVGLC